MGFAKKIEKGPPCKCGARSEAEHTKRLSGIWQVRGFGVKQAKPHKYTGPK